MFFYIMSDHCEILWVIRHSCYLDLGNSSNKFGNHWPGINLMCLLQLPAQLLSHCLHTIMIICVTLMYIIYSLSMYYNTIVLYFFMCTVSVSVICSLSFYIVSVYTFITMWCFYCILVLFFLWTLCLILSHYYIYWVE